MDGIISNWGMGTSHWEGFRYCPLSEIFQIEVCRSCCDHFGIGLEQSNLVISHDLNRVGGSCFRILFSKNPAEFVLFFKSFQLSWPASGGQEQSLTLCLSLYLSLYLSRYLYSYLYLLWLTWFASGSQGQSKGQRPSPAQKICPNNKIYLLHYKMHLSKYQDIFVTL